MRILLLDNYDSFTWNLVQMFEMLGGKCLVYRSDKITLQEVEEKSFDRIVISPGPFGPEKTGVCKQVIESIDRPILGVCLGMQVIAKAFGAKIVPSGRPLHGKKREIFHNGKGIFRGIKDGFIGGLYHSLIVEDIIDPLEITAKSCEGVVMGIHVIGKKVDGVMFHPESYLSEWGLEILENFYVG